VLTLNPLDLVKNVTGTATSLVRGAAELGLTAAGAVGEQVFRRIPGVIVDVVGEDDAQEPVNVVGEDDAPEPVNVVEELDLEPAPVDEVVAQSHEPAPATEIDAQADPGAVVVTPADIAEQVERGPGPTDS
jgi:hypothetical protein